MIIKRLHASFGRLSNETLSLNKGLNIIQAPNESGKSTWCAFIKAMLYGIRTSDRDKTGYLSVKTRYRPWSGAPMGGTMDIEMRGVAVTLQRTTTAEKNPMKNYSAVLTGSGEPYPHLFPDTAGETLTGVSEDVFERSAFISQAGIRVTQTPELEKRITALVATGDETVSYTETDERLRTWQRKRKFNKTGVIPALEDKLAVISDKLSEIETALDGAASIRLEKERSERRRQELSVQLQNSRRYEAAQSLAQAREEYERVRAGYDNIYMQLAKNGRVPTEDELAAIRGDLKALESLGALRHSEQLCMTEARTVYDNLHAQKDASAFSGKDIKNPVEDAEQQGRMMRRYALNNGFSIILFVMTAAFMALAALLPDFRLYAAGLTLAGAFLIIWRLMCYKSHQRKLKELLSAFCAESLDALAERHQAYNLLLEELNDAESTLKSAEKSVFSAAENYRSVYTGLAAKLEAAGLYNDPEGAARELSRIEALMHKLSEAKAETQAAESFLKTLKESDASKGSVDDIPKPERGREDIESELAVIISRLEEMTNRYNIALGEVRALGDPVVLGSEKKETEEALSEQTAQYEAISLAVNTLREAGVELQSRFSPLLGQTAGEILTKLTAGRYEKLAFNKSLDASAQTIDEPVSRSVLSLSAGTADQIYLALRLAVCELVLPEDNACPLILDDTLSNFDDMRVHLALDYLKEIARTRQVLLFSCHNREAEYFADSNELTFITL